MSLWAPLCSASDAHKNYNERDGWILGKEQKPLQKGVLVQQSHGMGMLAILAQLGTEHHAGGVTSCEFWLRRNSVA